MDRQIPRMKITRVDPILTGSDVFVRIETDAGIVGYGDATNHFLPYSVEGMLKDLIPYLISEDPARIEYLWQVCFRRRFQRGGPATEPRWQALTRPFGTSRAKPTVCRSFSVFPSREERLPHRSFVPAPRCCALRTRTSTRDRAAAGRLPVARLEDSWSRLDRPRRWGNAPAAVLVRGPPFRPCRGERRPRCTTAIRARRPRIASVSNSRANRQQRRVALMHQIPAGGDVLAEQQWQKTDAVLGGVVRQFRTKHLRASGHQVAQTDELVTTSSRLDHAGPANDEGNTVAAFGNVALVTSVRPPNAMPGLEERCQSRIAAMAVVAVYRNDAWGPRRKQLPQSWPPSGDERPTAWLSTETGLLTAAGTPVKQHCPAWDLRSCCSASHVDGPHVGDGWQRDSRSVFVEALRE